MQKALGKILIPTAGPSSGTGSQEEKALQRVAEAIGDESWTRRLQASLSSAADMLCDNTVEACSL